MAQDEKLVKLDGSAYVGELWPDWPTLTDPERIRWARAPGGFVFCHPDRPPMEVVDGELRYVALKKPVP